MWTTAAATTRCRLRATLPAGALDVQVHRALAQLRQGGGARRRPRSREARRGAVHGRRRAASAGADRNAGAATGTMDGYDVVYTAKAHRENESALRRLGSRWFYTLLNWGARHKISGGRRRLPPALAARRARAAPDAGAQPLLQRAGELDRLQADPRRLSTRRTPAWRDGLRLGLAARALDRGPDVILGRAAAACEPARIGARG